MQTLQNKKHAQLKWTKLNDVKRFECKKWTNDEAHFGKHCMCKLHFLNFRSVTVAMIHYILFIKSWHYTEIPFYIIYLSGTEGCTRKLLIINRYRFNTAEEKQLDVTPLCGFGMKDTKTESKLCSYDVLKTNCHHHWCGIRIENKLRK